MKAIRKIAALMTGATMLGATVMGAMALDLNAYPKPFVDGCSFSGAIVVGEKAASSDVAGAIDIASTLAVSGTTTATSGTSSVSVSGEAVKIEGSSDVLNINETLTSVKSVALDEDDLPTILAKGTFTAKDGDDFDYKQKLTLDDGLRFAHWSDSDYQDKTPTLGININDAAHVATYQLEFTKSAESDVDSNNKLEDLEDSTLTMLGNNYDIVEATNATNIKLELMGGATRDVLEQGAVGTYTLGGKKYDVEVTYIGGSPSKVKFKVNGEVTDAKEEGDTIKLTDGTQLGVREILEEEAGEVTADQVEFYIGAEKLTLENGDEIMMNDEDVDGITAVISATFSSTTKIDDIYINWTADDDLFVTEDSEVKLPGLESFKISYAGLSTPATEKTTIADGGDDVMQLKVYLEDSNSDPETLDLLGSDGLGNYTRIGGDGANEVLPTHANNIYYSLADGSKAQYFIATYMSGKTGESYLLKVDDADNTDGVDLKNVITGEVIEQDLKNGTAFTVGSATVTMTKFVENSYVNFTAGTNTYFDRLITKEGLLILLPTAVPAPQADYTLGIAEEDKDGNLGAGSWINVTLSHTSDDEVKVSGLTTASKALLSGANYFEDGDTDVYVGYMASALGTRVEFDQGPDQSTMELIYHGGESYGNVFISETEAGFGTATTSAGTAVCPVSVPAALLDTEVSSVSSQNLIVVGGPCANGAAADVMGVAMTWPECGADFEEGKASIKLFDTGAGKTAMLVAGMTALDTRRATRVLKNYNDYALSGDEVTVTGTSLTDISVSKVA